MRDYAQAFFQVLPQPGVSFQNGQVRLWYGDPRNPTLELTPIPLDSSRDR